MLLESLWTVAAGIPMDCCSWNPYGLLQLESLWTVAAGIPMNCCSWNLYGLLQAAYRDVGEDGAREHVVASGVVVDDVCLRQSSPEVN